MQSHTLAVNATFFRGELLGSPLQELPHIHNWHGQLQGAKPVYWCPLQAFENARVMSSDVARHVAVRGGGRRCCLRPPLRILPLGETTLSAGAFLLCSNYSILRLNYEILMCCATSLCGALASACSLPADQGSSSGSRAWRHSAALPLR